MPFQCRFNVVGIVFIICVGQLIPGLSVAATDKNDFSEIGSTFLEIISPDSPYAHEQRNVGPVWALPMAWDFLKYSPSLVSESMQSPCDSKAWLESHQIKLDQGRWSTTVDQDIVDFLDQCDAKIQRPFWQQAFSLYKSLMMYLPLMQYPYGHFVMLHLPQGNLVKGFLALKGDGKPRPLVIIRLGIFSNVTQFFPERFMFFQLFEQSPFNVLVLESNSGQESILRNKKLSFGGFDEGIQNFLIAEQLQKVTEPISKMISEIHLAAISMGGHGAWMASMLSDRSTQESSTSPVIASTLLYCPLTDLKSTMDFHTAPGLHADFFNYWVQNRLEDIDTVIPGLRADLFVPSLMQQMAKNYQGPAAFSSTLAFSQDELQHLQDFWWENNFWPFYKDIKTPVLVLATKVDPAVPFSINSGRIKNHSINTGSSAVQVAVLDSGVHCDFAGSYDWQPITTMAQAHILAHSHYRGPVQIKKIFLTIAEATALKTKDWPPKWDLQAGSDQHSFFVNFKLSQQPLTIKSLEFSWNELGFTKKPFAESENILRRWLEYNLNFKLVERANHLDSELIISWRP